MHKAILVWVGLLLIGSVSIVQCYSYQGERDFAAPLSKRRAESGASNDWSQLYSRLFESSDESNDESEEETRQVASGDVRCAGCKSDQLCYVPNKCSCPVGPTTSPCQRQSGGLCTAAATKNVKPAVQLDFGTGTSLISSATPASLGFSSNYKQVTDSKVSLEDGMFTIAKEVPGLHGTWLSGSEHTSNSKQGYMMVVNAAYGAGVVFQITVKDLTVGLRYQMAAYIANINKKGSNLLLPDVVIQAKTTDGVLIASTATGKVPEENALTWKQYGMSFVTPASTIVLSFQSNTGGGGGDDYALDDITLVGCASIIDNAACGGK